MSKQNKVCNLNCNCIRYETPTDSVSFKCEPLEDSSILIIILSTVGGIFLLVATFFLIKSFRKRKKFFSTWTQKHKIQAIEDISKFVIKNEIIKVKQMEAINDEKDNVISSDRLRMNGCSNIIDNIIKDKIKLAGNTKSISEAILDQGIKCMGEKHTEGRKKSLEVNKVAFNFQEVKVYD